MLKPTLLVAIVGAFLFTACATAPTSPSAREELQIDAQETLRRMQDRDPGLSELLAQSAGYAVFPQVGKGGALVGGAYGRGIVYQDGQAVGYVELNQASLGAQLGGETFAELIVFENERALQQLQNGTYDITGQASATALTQGAARGASFGQNGVAVFLVPRGGLMVDLSVAGQRLNYQPLG